MNFETENTTSSKLSDLPASQSLLKPELDEQGCNIVPATAMEVTR
jgi:hypothetical protein